MRITPQLVPGCPHYTAGSSLEIPLNILKLFRNDVIIKKMVISPLICTVSNEGTIFDK